MHNIIYFILLLLPLYLFRIEMLGIPTTIFELILYLSFFIFFVDSIYKKRILTYFDLFRKSIFFFPVLVFFASGAISIFFSSDRIASLGIFKAYIFDPVLFFFLYTSVIKNRDQVRSSIIALVISASVLSLVGLFHYFSFPEYLQDGRIKSVFASPNYLSMFLAPVMFLFFPLFRDAKKFSLSNLLLIISFLLIATTLLLTFSRGAWLGVILGVIFLLFFMALRRVKQIKKRLVILSIGLISALLSLMFISSGLYKSGIISYDRAYSSDNIRKEIWSTSLEIVRNNVFFGVGLGDFQNYFSEYTKGRINYPEYISPHALTPHNIFLNIWLQMGLFGLLSILSLIGIFFFNLYKRRDNDWIFSFAIMSSMVAIIGQGFVDSSIWKNDLMIFFWFLLSCSYIITKGEKNNAK